jgi:NAD(P)-dependent dehydrogenase (short-subunit alcohol dehydrogenase family)
MIENDLESDVQRTAIIISVSSDIGSAMASRWLERGWNVLGTYRTRSTMLDRLESAGLESVFCDVSSADSIASACTELKRRSKQWDILVLGAGTQEPIGEFMDTSFGDWEASIGINFTSQLGIMHELLPHRALSQKSIEPCVLFFAGGGTNNATVRYSAYTISKIALIKMCELLDAEIPDTRFSIIGPGWVGTKMHQETIKAGPRAGANLDRTKQKLSSDELTPMGTVLNFCDWIIDASREVVSGRNFSVVFDNWGNPKLDHMLSADPDMYKLRRSGNDKFPKLPTSTTL